jgi:hypothetical protein
MANKRKMSVLWTSGLQVLVLILGIFLIGCQADDGDSGGGGSQTSNPLVGTWADNPDIPTQLVAFTDTGNNTGVVYYATTLTQTTLNTTQKSLGDIFNTGNSPNYEQDGNTLTVKKFYLDSSNVAQDVKYTRREGTSKNGLASIWIPDSSTPDNNEYLLLITAANTLYYTPYGQWNYDKYEYRPNDNEVRWEALNNKTPTAATVSPNTGNLTFTLPGQPRAGTFIKSNVDF